VPNAIGCRGDLHRLLLRGPPGASDLLHHERAVGILGAYRTGELDLANAEGLSPDMSATSPPSLLIIAYVPLLGSFAALILAEGQGTLRVVTFMLIVVMSDTGGYVAGVLFGQASYGAQDQPKEVVGRRRRVTAVRYGRRRLHGCLRARGAVLGRSSFSAWAWWRSVAVAT
jgi:hypothetical protein